MTNNSQQCFFSYSWDSESHQQWVASLATALVAYDIRVKFDRWGVPAGVDLTNYMINSIKSSTHVLIICTPEYAKKANEGKGGVGFETMIITGALLSNISPETKFVPILRNGLPAEAIPDFLRTKRYIDFRDDDKFQVKLEELVQCIRFARIRSDAFVLGTMMVVNINAVSKQPRDLERVNDLWQSIEGLCRNIGIAVPSFPGRDEIISGDRAFKETMPILEQIKQTITRQYGSSVADPFRLGVVSALAGQFLQNPQLTSMATPLIYEIENLARECSISQELISPFIAALKSGDPQEVLSAIMSFTTDVSDALEIFNESCLK